MKFGRWLSMLAAAVVVLSGCDRSVKVTLPPVPTTVALQAASTPTLSPSRAAESLPTMPNTSTTTTTITLEGGTVTLTGVVTGPKGPIAGATVHIERLVNDEIATLDVTADKNGRYTASNIAGGRLRVRAWRVPDAAGSQNVVVFATNRTTLDLQVTMFGGTDVDWAIAPTDPVVGELANLAVQVTTKAVGDDGLAKVVPLPGVGVSLTALGAMQPQLLEQKLTDADGRVVFTLACNAAGPAPVDVSLATGEKASLNLPSCAVPTTTTTSTTPALTAPPVAPTESTVPIGGVATTAPPVVIVPVPVATTTTTLP